MCQASVGWAQHPSDPNPDLSSDSQLYEAAATAMHAGESERAATLLESLLRVNPRFVGAWLDLAMLYCQSGKPEEAHALLERLKSKQPEIADKVAALSPVVLGACEARPSRSLAPTYSFEMGGGYNSNVNLGASQREIILGSADSPLLLQLLPESKPRGDAYLEARGAVAAPLGQKDAVLASVFAREYSDMRRYNESVTSVDWQRYLGSGPWQGVVSAGHRWTFLNGGIYDRTLQASTELFTPLMFFGGRVSLGMNFGQTHYAEAQAFDVSSTLARVGIKWRPGAQIEAGWRRNAAINDRPGGNSYGYQIMGRYDFALAPAWRAGVHGRLQQLRDDSIFFPGLFDLRRSQRSWSLLTRVEHDLKNNWHAGVDFSFFSQGDSVPILSFQGNDLRLWLRRVF